MVRSIFRSAVVAVVLLATLAYAGPAAASHTTCTTPSSVDNPHFSTGDSSWVVKARIKCSGNVDRVDYSVALFLCPSYPTKTESWLLANCTPKGSNGGSIYNLTANTRYTRQAPPPGGASAHGTGYWIGCLTATARDHGEARTFVKFSAIVYGSG
jgi:hypothetical protein